MWKTIFGKIRFSYLLLTGLFLFHFLGPGITLARANWRPKGDNRPNIVMLMLDDLNIASLDTMLEHNLMPNLQRYFGNQGTQFTESFVTYALCAPSRATFLTGQYAHNHGVLSNNTGPQGGITRFNDTSTLATWLQAAGYRTVHIGKYINGYATDSSRSTPSPQDDRRYIPPGWTEWFGLVDPTAYQVFDFEINENGRFRFYPRGKNNENYQTDVLRDLAVNFINRNSDRRAGPFFMSVMPLAPHIEKSSAASTAGCSTDHPGPGSWGWGSVIRPDPKDRLEKPQETAAIVSMPLYPAEKSSFNEDDISDKLMTMQPILSEMSNQDVACLTQQYRSRLGSLLAVDDLIGEVFAALENQGRLDSTIVFLTSDNGYLQGEHRWGSKVFAFEEAIRVPLYVYGTRDRKARTIDVMVTNNDLAPTIADLADASVPPTVDGRSFKSLLDGTAAGAGWRQHTLIEYFYGVAGGSYRGVRTGTREDDLPPSIIFGELLQKGSTPERELYFLEEDPLEETSAHQSDLPFVASVLQEGSSLAANLSSCRGELCQELEN